MHSIREGRIRQGGDDHTVDVLAMCRQRSDIVPAVEQRDAGWRETTARERQRIDTTEDLVGRNRRRRSRRILIRPLEAHPDLLALVVSDIEDGENLR